MTIASFANNLVDYVHSLLRGVVDEFNFKILQQVKSDFCAIADKPHKTSKLYKAPYLSHRANVYAYDAEYKMKYPI